MPGGARWQAGEAASAGVPGGRRRKEGEVTVPAWLASGFAGLTLLIAASCATRLAIWRLRHRETEPQADGLHVLMGVAMAGMLEPGLSPVPDTAWRAVFTAAAAWFSWQAIRARNRRRPARQQCASPGAHAIECGAMLYMLLPARHASQGHALAMPGMSGPATAGYPMLALLLALFMLGYILWTADQLAGLTRAGAAGTRREPAAPAAARPPAPESTAHGGFPSRPALAPRFAASYKIAMSTAMGYMLVMML